MLGAPLCLAARLYSCSWWGCPCPAVAPMGCSHQNQSARAPWVCGGQSCGFTGNDTLILIASKCFGCGFLNPSYASILTQTASLFLGIQAAAVRWRLFSVGLEGLCLCRLTHTFCFSQVLPSLELLCSCITLWARVQVRAREKHTSLFLCAEAQPAFPQAASFRYR